MKSQLLLFAMLTQCISETVTLSSEEGLLS
jgi:hypothetical protein